MLATRLQYILCTVPVTLWIFRCHFTNVLYFFVFCSVDADVAAEETITETPLNKKIKDNTALLWRTLRIAVPFYLAVMILCSIGWLEPQCCDLQNNYKWSFALGLRYMNGPPPTWFSGHRNSTLLLPNCFCLLFPYLYIITYTYYYYLLFHYRRQWRGRRFDNWSFERISIARMLYDIFTLIRPNISCPHQNQQHS